MRNNLFLVALAVFGVGCGGGSSTPDAGAVETEAGAQETAAPLPYCTSKPALGSVTDLSGTWVVRMVGSQVVAPGFVAPFHTQSVFTILMTIRQTGTVVAADGRYCDRSEIDPPSALAPVVIPDQWAHTEKTIQRTGTFALGGDGFSVLSFSPPLVEVAGAVPDPADATLPTSAGDSRVIDEDGDGHPGITVNLNGQSISGSLYVVQEQTTSVLAIAVAPDRVEGALTFSSMQNVLGSYPTSLSDPNSLVGQALTKPGTTSPDPTPCSSTFAMVKIADLPGQGGAVDGGDVDAGDIDDGGVDGGAIGCEWVRAQEAILFPL